jgi:cysteinyl-tRNA synthetase
MAVPADISLTVHNTLSREKEPFQTVHPGKVGMYLCGPTVYKPSHIGHMVGPIIFDTVKRYLQYLGYEVTWVVNITDVDDKLIVRAKELGIPVKELAEKMTRDYCDCLKKLRVTGIDLMPRATEHIPEMIDMIARLIEKGHAYPAGGDVYFDITKDADYGKLCHRDPEQMEAGARIEVSDKKRNPGDFALWKGAKPGEPQWESPWGPGRPGWHIECSAMSMKYLGQTLDIHGGGLDLQFPHHENELAQSESYSGVIFSRYWMHNGLLKLRSTEGKLEKMAGSVGNVINVVDLLRQHNPETVRFLVLGTHYRSPIDYNDKRLDETNRALDGFYRFFERLERVGVGSFFEVTAPTTAVTFDPIGMHREFLTEVQRARRQFLAHMNDDFNTGGAIGVLHELLTLLNRFADTQQLEGPQKSPESLAEFRQGVLVLKELTQILGLFEERPAKAAGGNDQLVQGLMQLLIDLRAESRKAKNFALADQIRQRLAKLNITLEDRPGGTGWRQG